MKPFAPVSLLAITTAFASPVPILVDSFSTSNFYGSSTATDTIIQITGGSTVNFFGQSTAGDAFISIDSTSQLNFAQTGASNYSGLLSGTGPVFKTGSGNLTLTGNNSAFPGTFFMQVGTLFLHGNYGGSIISSPGTQIFYAGAITGDLTVDGGIITTNGLHTLQIGGNYSQINNAIYLVNINAAGQSMLLNIAGSANLSGFVQVDTSLGVYFLNPYTILHANGGVTGTYSLLGSYPGLSPMITYDQNNVYLSFTPDFLSLATTQNERRVASQLDSLTSLTSDEAEVLSAVILAGATEALNQMSGEQYTSFTLASLSTCQRFSQTLYDAYRNQLNPCLVQCDRPHVWLSGGAGKGFQNGNQNAQGFDAVNYNLATGIHSIFSNTWLLGGGLGYERDYLHTRLPSQARVNSGQAAIYGAYQAKHLYLLSDIISGVAWTSYTRPIQISSLSRQARSKPRIFYNKLDLEFGGHLGYCHYLIEPYFAASAELYHQNTIKEHGAGALNLQLQSFNAWLGSTSLGMHYQATISKHFIIGLDLAWKHYYGNLLVSEKARFAGFGDTFIIEGPPRGHNGALGTLFISSVLDRCFTVYFKASGELWHDWHAYEFSGGVSF